jgi:hypothetical protein
MSKSQDILNDFAKKGLQKCQSLFQGFAVRFAPYQGVNNYAINFHTQEDAFSASKALYKQAGVKSADGQTKAAWENKETGGYDIRLNDKDIGTIERKEALGKQFDFGVSSTIFEAQQKKPLPTLPKQAPTTSQKNAGIQSNNNSGQQKASANITNTNSNPKDNNIATSGKVFEGFNVTHMLDENGKNNYYIGLNGQSRKQLETLSNLLAEDEVEITGSQGNKHVGRYDLSQNRDGSNKQYSIILNDADMQKIKNEQHHLGSAERHAQGLPGYKPEDFEVSFSTKKVNEAMGIKEEPNKAISSGSQGKTISNSNSKDDNIATCGKVFEGFNVTHMLDEKGQNNYFISSKSKEQMQALSNLLAEDDVEIKGSKGNKYVGRQDVSKNRDGSDKQYGIILNDSDMQKIQDEERHLGRDERHAQGLPGYKAEDFEVSFSKKKVDADMQDKNKESAKNLIPAETKDKLKLTQSNVNMNNIGAPDNTPGKGVSNTKQMGGPK